MARKVGYGIDYRDMHTAIHGIIWVRSRNKSLIEQIYDVFLDLESDDPEAVSNAEADLEFYLGHDYVEVEDEINFRDITKDGKYYLNDDEYILILNDTAFDLYGF